MFVSQYLGFIILSVACRNTYVHNQIYLETFPPILALDNDFCIRVLVLARAVLVVDLIC